MITDVKNIKLIAFDLDGTLSEHKQPIGEDNRSLLDALGKDYKIIMVAAASAEEIFRQMLGYPIDIIGNYGMQYAEYDSAVHGLKIVYDRVRTVNQPMVTEILNNIQKKH